MYVYGTPHPELPDYLFLIDTGAQVSMMPLSWYNGIPPEQRPPLEETNLRIMAANKTTFRVSGCVRVAIKIHGIEYPCTLHISPDEDVGILGMDFMHDYHVILNPTDMKMSINNRLVPILNDRGQRLNCKIKAAKTVILQPGERYVVPGQIQRPELEDCTVVIDTVASLVQRHGVVAARVIAKPRLQQLPVELRNGSDEIVKIHKGTVLGVASTPYAMQPWVDPREVDDEGNSNTPSDVAYVKRVSAQLAPDDDVSAEGLPEHVKGLYTNHCDEMCSEDQKLYKGLLMKYSDVFAKSKTDLGCAKDVKHHIDTGDEKPFKHKPRRLPMGKFEAMKEHVETLHEHGVIRPSQSNWGSNVLLVKKKDGSWRMCVDYRELNAKTKNIDPYMLPRIDDTLESLGGAKYFCTLDLISGYHQVELSESSKPKTAFLTPRLNPSQWEFNMMPFGINGGPSTFQRVIDRVLHGLEYKIALAYLDDIIVYGKDAKECCARLAMVFERLREANLKLKPSKCEMFQLKTIFLGHVISAEGISCDPKKVEAVKNWETPRTARQVQVFLGSVNYYNRFIKGFSEIAQPLFVAANRKYKKFNWTPECQQAFETLRLALISAPVMAFPRREGLFVLDTDASAFAIGGVLSQRQKNEQGEEVERVIAYASRTLEKRERNYCTRRRELLAIVHFVKHFKPYLWGQECLIRTDHASLRYVKTLKEPDDQIARWISKLEETYYVIETRKGKNHANADALSRLPSSGVSDCENKKKCICSGVAELESNSDEVIDCHPKSSVAVQQQQENVAKVMCSCNVEFDDFEWPQEGEDPAEEVDEVSEDEVDVEDMEVIDDNLDRSQESEEIDEVFEDEMDAEVMEVEVVQLNDAHHDGPEKSENELLLFTEKWSAEVISEAQKSDFDIAVIYAAKQAGADKPSASIISGMSDATKAYMHDWPRLVIKENGVLYRTLENHEGTKTTNQILLPAKFRKEMCSQFHDAMTSGHVGRRKTIKLLTQRFHWHKLAEDVRWWIKTCERCQYRKCPHAWPKAPLTLFLSGMPNERVAMDIVDHLQITNAGNCCVLTITDHFTKFVKAIPLPDQTAKTIADAFMFGWVTQFGAPHSLHTDQGRNFESGLISEVCDLLNTYKTHTTPYHPAGNGQTERYNRTMMDLIHAEARKNPMDWDRTLPMACMAYNSTVHSTTGFEPNRLWLGRNVYLPVDRMMPQDPDVHPLPVHEYARRLDEDVRRNFASAREHINRAATAQKKYYDRNAHLNEYQVGDTVKLRVFRKTKGIGKFIERFDGPYFILDVNSKVNFRIIKTPSSKARVVHHDQILPYLLRENDTVDKEWVFKRSRTYRPLTDAATSMTASQHSDGPQTAITVKDVASDPIKMGQQSKNDATQTAYEADVSRSAVAYQTRGRNAQFRELKSRARNPDQNKQK